MTIPTTQQLVDQAKAFMESRLNQTTPASDRAFNTVVAVMFALSYTSQYKYAADRFLAALVQTAKGSDLDLLGAEYAIARHQAVAAVLTLTLTGTNATVIPAGAVFVSPGTGSLYTNNASGTIAVGTVTLTVTATDPGSSPATFPTARRWRFSRRSPVPRGPRPSPPR